MTETERAAIQADALSDAAAALDELAIRATAHIDTEWTRRDAGQMRNDARWLRKQAVTIRAQLLGN